MNLTPWSLPLKIIACSFHSFAIACTIFRLAYRCYLAHFWLEDGLASFALIADSLCLAAAWLEQPSNEPGSAHRDFITNWISAIAFVCVLWACRLSILCSIIRIVNPPPVLRRVCYAIGAAFIIMWIALLGQKIQICAQVQCLARYLVGLSQLITDVISDFALVVLPIYLLRQSNINSRQRITIFSIFSASALITVVTIIHSVALFTGKSDGTIVIAHVKTALSLVVCNLLVIVAFIYRLTHRDKGTDLELSDDVNAFTTVDLNTGLTQSSGNKCTTISNFSDAQEMSRFTIRTSEEKTRGTVASSLADFRHG